MTVANWESQYDVMRRQVVHNWVDWSQDGCSAPWIATALAEITTSVADYNEVFHYGCLRHDMMWRMLPIVDGGTGRIWNERNRLAADEKFKDDSIDACTAAYPDRQDSPLLPTDAAPAVMREKCNAAAELFYGGVCLRYGVSPWLTTVGRGVGVGADAYA